MIGLMWFLLGMATAGGIWGYVELSRHFQLDWKATLGFLAAFGFAWLCVSWSWASFAEGEPQSGAMGLLWFGLPALIFAVVTWRNISVVED